MRRIVLLLSGLAIFASTANLSAGDFTKVPWTEANIETLRSFDKAAVVRFLNKRRREEGIPSQPMTENDLDGFRWADFAGDGSYQLVLTTSGPCAHFVTILEQDRSGKVTTTESLAGWSDLKKDVKDLNGDGKDELILQTLLVEHDCANELSWPAVYRLEKGKYVEASSDFPAFYDNEVLPKLDGQISRNQAQTGHENSVSLAEITMVRDKILRVLGREPTAGLQQAYQWMNSDDPDLLQDAAATFKEIGGHDKELRAANASYTRASCERYPSMAVCRNTAER